MPSLLPAHLSATGRLLALLLGGASAAAAPAAASPEALRAACQAPTHATVLRADAAAHPARAVWLDVSRLQWPGAPAQGRYRLAQAVAGGLVAAVGEPLRGAAGAVPCARQPCSSRARRRARGTRRRPADQRRECER